MPKASLSEISRDALQCRAQAIRFAMALKISGRSGLTSFGRDLYWSWTKEEGKMKKLLCIIPSVFLLAMITGCQRKAAEPAPAVPAVDIAAEKALIMSVIDEYAKSNEAEDIEVISRIFAHDDDMVTFGTDAAEYWVGYEPFRQATIKQFEAVDSGKATFTDVRIKVHKSGEVAWLTGFVRFTGNSAAQPFNVTARLTYVLEKRDGRWIVVHTHASIPVAGQAVKY
jgi:ketosteroid isomerase-like protein